MSTPDRDEEFEAFLARRSLLPRALAEQENAEPPPEVDRSVLCEAQAAVNAAPARKSFRRNRWSVPMALAATVLISLAIVVQVQRPSSEPVVMPRQALEPARAPLERDFAEEPEPDIGALSDSPKRFAKASAPAESRALIASANEMRRTDDERADELDADASTAATAQARREAYAASPARGATDSVAAVEAENGKARAPAAAAGAERDPKAWLERIAKLRAEGKHAQADREFKAFVKRYPDYVTDEAAK